MYNPNDSSNLNDGIDDQSPPVSTLANIYKRLDLKLLSKMAQDAINLFRPYKDQPVENAPKYENRKYSLKTDIKSVVHGFKHTFIGLAFFFSSLTYALLTLTLIWPIVQTLRSEEGKKISTLLSYPSSAVGNLLLGLIHLARGITQLAAFFSGLTILKIMIRALVTFNLVAKNNVLSNFKGIFIDISKDFRNTFTAYKAKSYLYNDALQFFDGLRNILAGLNNLLLSAVSLALSLTLIVPIGMFFVRLFDSKNIPFTEKLLEAGKGFFYFHALTFIALATSAALLFRGITEVVFYPLTVVKIAARSFLTWWRYGDKYQPLQENTDIKRLVKEVRDALEKKGSIREITDLLNDSTIKDKLVELEEKSSNYQSSKKGQAAAISYNSEDTLIPYNDRHVFTGPIFKIEKYDTTTNAKKIIPIENLTIEKVKGRLEYFTLTK